MRGLNNQSDTCGAAALQSSGENHLFCRQNHQWDATQYNVLRVVLQPVVFSNQELAEVFYRRNEVSHRD